MATLKDYFEADFRAAAVFQKLTDAGGTELRYGLDAVTGASFIAAYLSQSAKVYDVCIDLVQNHKEILKRVPGPKLQDGPGEKNLGVSLAQRPVFSKRIFIYMNHTLSADLEDSLRISASVAGLVVTIRAEQYKAQRELMESGGAVRH